MKILLSISLALGFLVMSCKNNTAGNEKHNKDSVSRDGGYSPDTSASHDTSSYQRMPNKVSDSPRQ